jgi:hypothetical protein
MVIFRFFGDFEKNPTWSQRLETEYMEKNSIVYGKLNGEQDEEWGCYERVTTHAKWDVVRAINNAMKRTHDLRIVISRDGVEASKKFDKRSNGPFYIRENSSVSKISKGRVFCG